MRVWQKALLLSGLPAAFAALGYGYLKVIWHPPRIGHGCFKPGSDCFYPTPHIASALTWTILGALVGLWAGYVAVRVLSSPKRAAFTVGELLVVTLVVAGVVWWTWWTVFEAVQQDGVPRGFPSDQAHVIVLLLGAIAARLLLSLVLGRRTSARHWWVPVVRAS